jgi:hypothetical protein
VAVRAGKILLNHFFESAETTIQFLQEFPSRHAHTPFPNFSENLRFARHTHHPHSSKNLYFGAREMRPT